MNSPDIVASLVAFRAASFERGFDRDIGPGAVDLVVRNGRLPDYMSAREHEFLKEEGSALLSHRDAGWAVLGSGAFSLALVHPDTPERVLLVCYETDVAKEDWWDFCQQHQGSDHIPDIYLRGEHEDERGYRMAWCWTKRYLPIGCAPDSSRSVAAALVYGPSADWDTWALVPPNLRYLREELGVWEHGVDLHWGNIMWCPDRQQLILTDPVA